MLKEIHEQPEALENALRGRLGRKRRHGPFRRPQPRRATAAASRSHRHDGVRHQLPRRRSWANICSRNSPACRWKWNMPASFAIAIRRIDRNTIVVALTQSGETADTLAALRESKRKGHPTLALCNVVGSSIAREADGGVYLHAGPEIGVASTKAFTNQVARPGDAGALLRPHAPSVQHAGIADDPRAAGHARTCRADAGLRASRSSRSPSKYHHASNCPLPWPAVSLPGGAGRRIEAEGNQLHPRRGLSGGGDETWTDRAGGRTNAVGLPGAARRRSSTR